MKSLSHRLKLNVLGLQYVRMCVCVLPVSVLMICYFQLFDSDLDGFWLTPTFDWTSKWAKHQKFIKQLYDQSGLLHVYHLSQTQRRYLLRMSSLTSSGKNTHKSAHVSNLLPTVVSLSSLNQTWGAKSERFFFSSNETRLMMAAAQLTEGQLAGQAWTKDLLQVPEIWHYHSHNLVTMASHPPILACHFKFMHVFVLDTDFKLLKIIIFYLITYLHPWKNIIAFINKL